MASPDPVTMAGMSEGGSEASRAPSETERLLPRDCLVQQEEFTDNEYSLGTLDLVGEEPAREKCWSVCQSQYGTGV